MHTARPTKEILLLRRVLATALVTAGLLGGAALPASAAPAQVVRSSDCFTHTFNGSVSCIDRHSLFNVAEKSPGNYLVVENSKMSYTLTRNGVVVETQEQRSHSVVRVREGETLINNTMFRGQMDFPQNRFTDECFYETRYLLVRGEVKVNESMSWNDGDWFCKTV